jgi:hypothetical protein
MTTFPKIRSFLAVLAAGVAFLAVCATPASAATDKKADYKGTIVSQTVKTITLKPKESVVLKLSVKNTGKATWTRSGAKYISIYTYFPKYRTSVFADKSWFHNNQPATLNEKSVKPGAVGNFDFKLTAPDKAGIYDEGFWLAAEGFTWIEGTQFKVVVTVPSTKPVVTPPATTTPTPVVSPPTTATAPVTAPATPSTAEAAPLSATLLIKSFQQAVVLAGGKTAAVTVGFKNVGSVVWQTRVLRIRGTTIASSVSLADSNWPNALEPSRVREPISPGSVGFFSFNVQAPASRGDYKLPLKLVIDGQDVAGTEFDIPVVVTEDAPELPSQQMPMPDGTVTEPLIRVGLWAAPGDITVSNSVDFNVVDENGVVLARVPANTNAVVSYNRTGRTVSIYAANGSFFTAHFVRLVPTDPSGLFKVPNFAGWIATAYENQFRGTLEVNYYQPNDNVWLIEELPLELYLQGIGETGNGSEHEFQKALLVAARNYAYYVHAIGGKYALFDVGTGAADQVYRAYGSETIRPNVVLAAQETRGQMVIYNNDIVVTPYFSRSDGRTRSWGEVWCCKLKPWLVSVPAPHDTGKTLWGHGVGMSAEDALGWAKDGKTYDWILKYFYTGTTLKKVY